MEGWACPVDLAPVAVADGPGAELLAAVRAEIALLSPWYDEAARTNQGRHLDGMTELTPEDVAEYLVGFLENQDQPGPIEGEPLVRGLKLAIDDLRHFYYQAALARPGGISDVRIGTWFYGETMAGRLYLMLRDALKGNPDPALDRFSMLSIVPSHQAAQKVD